MIGEAFVGPSTIKIRADIAMQSAPVATAKHGDRLAILQKRRTFIRVRTPSGIEGWTDERALLGPADMAQLKSLSDIAAKMPSQGSAVPRFGDMRVYSQPSIGSPSFLTVKDKERVDVLATLPLVRSTQARPPLVTPPAKKAVPKKKPKAQSKLVLPPPKLPEPPPGWDYKGPEENQPPEPSDTPAPPTDYWSLIRTSDTQAGWTLTRRLLMAIPDEVAQYAEGKRIVSYFSLGKAADREQPHEVWLWTTIHDGIQSYDFDSFRVFTWSARRHHYETAHIESNVRGYQPVLVETETVKPGKGRVGAGESHPGFSVCVENREGARVRREFALVGERIFPAGDRPCEAAPSLEALIHRQTQTASPAPAAPPETESLGAKLSKHWHSLKRRVFGK